MGNKKRNRSNNEDTKRINKTNKPGKKKKNIKGKKKKIFFRILKIAIVLLIVMAGVCAGLIVGMSNKYAITKDDLIINYSNSMIYDIDGNLLASLSAVENRKILQKEEMGEYLPKAFVSIEDKRFYNHHGVDFKRTGGAIATFVFNKGSSSFGGSTITQQLVKNITNEKEDSGVAGAVRKVKEMIRACQVENILSKDQILDLYMNIIFLGGKVYGVGMASQYYFSKDAIDLDLAESAFIAGVTHSPNSYNPFVENPNTEIIKSRSKTVLSEMKKNGYITEEQYNSACEEVNNGLAFKKGTISDQASYSSHTEALINQILDQLVTEKGMDREYAKTYLNGSGLKIYSTQVNSIQKDIEEEFAKEKYRVVTTVTKTVDGQNVKEKEAAQAAMVIIDQSTGYVVGSVGVLGEKQPMELNRVTQTLRQPGSSIKPIGVYGPALQEGVITAASVYEDKKVSYGNWSPSNSYAGYKGLSNMRQAIKISTNTIAVQVMNDLKPATSLSYLRRLGITSLKDTDENLSLALGGITDGISPLEMAAAYAAIANDGEYISPTFYTKVEDSEGNIILEAKTKREKVFSEANAYILKQLLIEPTQAGGTASACKISGMDTAAKTGTTNSKKDKWLCGFTPYYTAATWYGYDTPTAIPSGATSNANTIWKNVMAIVHQGLENKAFIKPENIVTATVCTKSGLLVTDNCKSAESTYAEYFVKGTVPTAECTYHSKISICKKSGMLVGDNCKDIEERVLSLEEIKKLQEKGICNICKADTGAPKITLNGKSIITLTIGEKYTEPGAKATDGIEGDLTSKITISGNVDESKAGTYTITYTVSDTAGNTASVTRTVKVEEKQSPSTPSTDKNTNNTNTSDNNTTDKNNTNKTS